VVLCVRSYKPRTCPTDLIVAFRLMGNFSHLVNLSAMLGRNWKTLIYYDGKTLMNFIESYKSLDGKKRCHFVTCGQHFVSPDSSVVTRSQQDNTTTASDVSLRLSISSQEQSSIDSDNLCDIKPRDFDNMCIDFKWGEVDGEHFL